MSLDETNLDDTSLAEIGCILDARTYEELKSVMIIELIPNLKQQSCHISSGSGQTICIRAVVQIHRARCQQKKKVLPVPPDLGRLVGVGINPKALRT